VPALFDDRAAQQPRALAVLGTETEISYGQLASQSNRLAHYLRDSGIGRETVVGVCLDRGVDVIRCLLAILKAGGAYLPLDPSLPRSRLTRMCEQAGAAFVLAGHADARHGFTGTARATLIDLRQVTLEGQCATPPEPAPSPADLAYAICTSGSTGQPKAVAVSHHSLARVIPGLCLAYQVTPEDRILQMASLGFDTSIEQILVALLSGATVVLPPDDPIAPADLPGFLARQRVTVVDLTPAYWHRMLATTNVADERLRGVRLMITGGDAASPRDCLAALAAAPHARLLNAYGLTETTITSTLFEVSAEEITGSGPVPVGRPLPHTRVLVLGSEREPVPAGTIGEVYIAGAGLARGYLGLSGLTQERFPVIAGARMFRTGDLGRLRSDGNLEVIGRVDRMLKIRGFRVEPAEIETFLATLPAIDQVAVVAHDVAHGDKQLVAYYTPGPAAADSVDLRRSVAARLPAFMVPAAFVRLDHLPLIHDGKVDRQALEHPVVAGGNSPDGERYTLVQAGMSHLWSRLLGTERTDLDDDFFRLGGNSLLAAEMLAHVRVMFGIGPDYVRPLTRSLLRDPTLRGFCAATEDTRAGLTGNGDAAAGIDIAAETALGVPVVTASSDPPRWTDPQAILLTGATGFFGIHLLRELLDKTSARVYCLVRAGSPGDAAGRIAATAKRYEVDDLPMDRVVMVNGDLAEPELGLRAEEFDQLARTVDVIYHLGATVNFIYPYEELRAANVGGTRELVRLAGRYRGIPLHYVSSTAVLAGFGVAGVRAVSEDEPLAHPDRLCVGYVQSKYVAEELLRNASKAGLPVTICRPMDIIGSERTAAWNTGTEMCALIRFMADTGTAPDIDLPLDFVPADVFAAALTQLSSSLPDVAGRTFHISAPEYVTLGFLVDRMRGLGFAVTQVPYREWVHGLLKHAAGDPSHPMTPFVPLFVDHCPGTDLTIAEMYQEHVFPAYTRVNTEEALRGTGIEFPVVGADLLDRPLGYLIATGFLPRAALRGLGLVPDAVGGRRSPGRLLRGPEPGQRPGRVPARPHPVPRGRGVRPRCERIPLRGPGELGRDRACRLR
jgi:amino acid adenylation domain-containing protein/thioester reductase-like protein